MASVKKCSDYYPFGLKMPGLSYIANGADENTFTYNGKELEDEFGLDWYHYGWRFYDPAVGRWWEVDALDIEHSPYNYSFNDPIRFVDPDGNNPVCGKSNNCDATYTTGSIVSNKHGEWEYLGNNEWKNLGMYGQVESASWVYASFMNLFNNNHATIQQYSAVNSLGELHDRIEDSNFLVRTVGESAFDVANTIYWVATLQGGRYRKNITGEVVWGHEVTETGLSALINFAPSSRVTTTLAKLKMPEISTLNAAQFSSRFRGSLIRMSASTRGYVNRAYNFVAKKISTFELDFWSQEGAFELGIDVITNDE